MPVPFSKILIRSGFHALCFSFILCCLALVQPANAQNQQKLLILGDSLSAGYGLTLEQSWAHLLQLDWASHYPDRQIINASISGDTTQGGVNRLPKLIEQHKPTWVLIELGGNDGLRGFQLPVIKQNLIQLVQICQQNNVIPILAEIKIPPNYGQRYVSRFIEQYHQIANEFKLELIPFFIESVATQADLMQADGIHPNAQAQPILKDYMKTQLDKAITPN